MPTSGKASTSLEGKDDRRELDGLRTGAKYTANIHSGSCLVEDGASVRYAPLSPR